MTYVAADDRYTQSPYRRTGRSGVDLPEISLAEEDVTYLEELYKPVVNLLSIGTS